MITTNDMTLSKFEHCVIICIKKKEKIMKLKEINNSSKKTKNLLKKAFAELMEEKMEINNITVTDLVKKANLTRGTFYTHYDNIYDLGSEIQEEILDKFFNQDMIIKDKDSLSSYIDSIFQYLKENENFYAKLSVSNDAILFMNRLNKKICHTISDTLGSKTNHLNIIFFTDGTINLIVQYFKKEIDESLDEIRDYIKLMANLLFIN